MAGKVAKSNREGKKTDSSVEVGTGCPQTVAIRGGHAFADGAVGRVAGGLQRVDVPLPTEWETLV